LIHLTRRGRPRQTADVPIKFKPYIADLVTIDSLAKERGMERPAIVRMLISEALTERRLRAAGKDEARHVALLAQKEAMVEALAPFAENLKSISSDLRRVEGRIAKEFNQTDRRLNFLILCARFIVFEVFVCRQLMRDYIHTVYVKFVKSIDKPVSTIAANFEKRVQKYKAEAAGKLDELTNLSVNDLHAMTDEDQGFRYE
jgi:hypothetical protein